MLIFGLFFSVHCMFWEWAQCAYSSFTRSPSLMMLNNIVIKRIELLMTFIECLFFNVTGWSSRSSSICFLNSDRNRLIFFILFFLNSKCLCNGLIHNWWISNKCRLFDLTYIRMESLVERRKSWANVFFCFGCKCNDFVFFFFFLFFVLKWWNGTALSTTPIKSYTNCQSKIKYLHKCPSACYTQSVKAAVLWFHLFLLSFFFFSSFGSIRFSQFAIISRIDGT